jgi:superfamily II DNA or RNA helicase
MKGLYIVTSNRLEQLLPTPINKKTLKFGMSENIEHRVFDYHMIYPDARYRYCYIFKNHNTRKEILQIEKFILDYTKINSVSEYYQTEYRSYNNFDEYNKLIIKVLDYLDIDYETLENKIFDKPKNINHETLDRSEELDKINLDEKIFDKELNNFNKIILRDDQKIDIINFENDLVKSKSGILMKPTGTGKFIEAMCFIGIFLSKYPNLSVLFITERKDILKSHFENSNKIDMCKNSGFIPTNLTISNYKKFRINDTKKYKLVITNNSALVTNGKYKLINNKIFGFVIVDECHWLGATNRYEFIKYIKKHWINLKYILGMSATPMRDIFVHVVRMKDIFNNNFISKMYITDAIEKNIIVKPNYVWIETKINTDDGKIDLSKHELFMLEILEQLNKITKQSVTKKGICWTSRTYNCDKWLEVINKNKSKFDELKKFKFLITYSNCTNDGLDEFLNNTKYIILIAVGRCIEGYDDPKVDFCGNLDYVKERTITKTTQQIGRCLRKYGNKECGIIFDGLCFDGKTEKINKIINDIVEYIIFIERIDNEDNKREIFEKVKKNIKVTRNNIDYGGIKFNFEELKLRDVKFDDIKERINLLIKSKIIDKSTLLQELKEVRIYIKKLNITDKLIYRDLCKDHKELIKNPEIYFSKIWKNWYDFLQVDTTKFIQNKIDWKNKCIELKIENYENYKKISINYPELPNMPDEFYKDFSCFENELKKRKHII